MGVTVCLPLFGEPGRELGEGTPLRAKELRDLADGLGDRLRKAADVLDALSADGWSARAALFDAVLAHPAVRTREEALGRLRARGADPEEFVIVEDVDEDEGVS
jgi:hypothetical protein